MKTGSRFALAATLLALVLPAGAVHAQDPCLVGTWEPQGNAMVDWMRRKNPQMPMQFRHDSASLTFRADGSYSADMRGEGSARGPAGTMARMAGQFGGSGRWSTADGRLTLVQGADHGRAEMELSGPDGTRSRSRVPTATGAPQALGYRCGGDRFETRLQMPGGDTIVQPYLRRRG